MVLQSSKIDVKLCNGVCLPQHNEEKMLKQNKLLNLLGKVYTNFHKNQVIQCANGKAIIPFLL
jgi:hypothetical protein